MKKLSNEQPTIEADTPFKIETKISKEESLDPNKLLVEDWDALITALKLLAKNKNKDVDTGTLEIKINPETGEESAIVYKDSDHKVVYATDYSPEIYYLKNPDTVLEQLEIENEKRRKTNKLIKNIRSGKVEMDKES